MCLSEREDHADSIVTQTTATAGMLFSSGSSV